MIYLNGKNKSEKEEAYV